MRKSVSEFAEGMEKKLKKHDKDYGVEGWLDCDDDYLIERLIHEIAEYKQSGDKEEMFDVANFAMMIWDKRRY